RNGPNPQRSRRKRGARRQRDVETTRLHLPRTRASAHRGRKIRLRGRHELLSQSLALLRELQIEVDLVRRRRLRAAQVLLENVELLVETLELIPNGRALRVRQ